MKYAIINTVDRPHARMVVEIIDGKCYYMARCTEKSLESYDGMEVRPDTTSMEDFGFVVEEIGDYVTFQKVWPSEAKYHNGDVRQWQGETYFAMQRVKLESVGA